MRAFLVLLLFGSVAACRTPTSHSREPTGLAVTRTVPVRAWEMWDAGRCLGSVVRFEVPGETERAFYSVMNREGQELGLVDLQGRAWRHRPHASEAEWLGTGTVLQGARRVLGGAETATLEEVEIEQLRAVLERLR